MKKKWRSSPSNILKKKNVPLIIIDNKHTSQLASPLKKNNAMCPMK